MITRAKKNICSGLLFILPASFVCQTGWELTADSFKQENRPFATPPARTQESIDATRNDNPGDFRTLSESRRQPALTEDDFRRHIEELRKRLPHEDFHIRIQKPFVVIGDESVEMLTWRSRKTIQWAVDRLKPDYFSKDPEHIIDIWLFKDRASYEKHVPGLLNRKPHTPYGFYSPRHRALVMNIATGGGTLVHEIVHPFIEVNFPECPAWFNEGLASLYEQSRDNDGRIWGMTNWRLRGLQLALESDRVPPFKQLCAMTRRQFYQEDRGTNYAQARYLCYYLQQKGLLKTYYRQFVNNVESDPTGYETLQQVLKRRDMETFQGEWRRFVLALEFER